MWKFLKENKGGHRNGSARIDRAYTNTELLQLFGGIQITPIAFSDHMAISFELKDLNMDEYGCHNMTREKKFGSENELIHPRGCVLR